MRATEQFLQDIRFGIRNLGRSPGFTAIAVVSLALGIMATTAIYSVVHGVVLDPFPYKDVDSLMSVRVWDPSGRGGRLYYSPDQFLEIAGRSTIFNGVVASTISDILWSGQGEPQRLRGNYVTNRTFEVMGVPPLLGRPLNTGDFAPDAPPAVVLGYKFWIRQFGGDPGVLGRQMLLNDRMRTVVGVMPKRFMWRGADVYLPIVLRLGQRVEGVTLVHVLGRLKPGVTEARAEADLRPIIEEMQKAQPKQFPDKFRVGLLSFKETFPSGIRQVLWVLFGAVGLLLLIACANVSNLLLSKATARQKEMAVRSALGAGRARLVQQLLTESLVLAIAGGLLGIALAHPALNAIIALVPANTIPDESEIVINTPVLAFSVGVSVLTALLFGLAPALHTCRRDLAHPLKETARSAGAGLRQTLLRSGLVVIEVALSLILLVGAGLMMRSLAAIENVDYGIRPDRVLTLRVPLSDRRYPDAARRSAFYRDLLGRVAGLPGVLAAAVNTGMHPLGGWGAPVEVAGAAQQDSRPALIHQVSADYLKVFGIPMLGGRAFLESEIANRGHVAMVNQMFTRRYLGGASPLGRSLRVPRMRSAPFNAADDSFEIVGLVRDTVNRGWTAEVLPEIYIPYTITAMPDRLVVLTQADPNSVTNAVRAQVYAIDKDQPVTEVKTVDRFLDEWVYSGPRFTMVLFGIFAAFGLALATVGVYGILSSWVAQQTQEIGVRMALGASFGDVLRIVLGRGLRLLGCGIALGLGGSLASVRLLRQAIFNVSPFDPVAFTAVSLLLLMAGLQACFWPARRAARIDPSMALRHE